MELRDYLGVLARRRAIIIFVTLAVTAAAVAIGISSTKVATARATAIMPSVRADGMIVSITPDIALERELELARSAEVFDRAASEIGESSNELRAMVSVAPATATSKGTIVFTATDKDAKRAAAAANGVADAYVTVSNESLLSDLQRYRDAVRAGSAQASDEVRAFLESLDGVTGLNIGSPTTDLDLRLADLSALIGMESSHAWLVETASPSTPESSPGRNAALGVTLGLFLGIAGALVQEQLDDRIRDVSTLRRSYPGVPVFDACGSAAHSVEDAVSLLAASLTADASGAARRLALATPAANVTDADIVTGLSAALGSHGGATIVDAGSLLESAEIARFAENVDGVVLVVARGVTRAPEVTKATALLGDLGLPLRAIVARAAQA